MKLNFALTIKGFRKNEAIYSKVYSMNYEEIYSKIISRAKEANREKGVETYYEKHHIVPRCIGGSNEKSNMVLLTAKEHFLCHKILTYIYKESKQLAFAFIAICNVRNKGQVHRYTPTSREYQQAKQHYGQLMQGSGNPRYGKEGYWKGKQKSEEHIDKIRCGNLGNQNRRGKELSVEARLNVILANQARSIEIHQYTKQGIFVNTYSSIKEAGELTGISRGNISTVKDTRRRAGGYLWTSKKVT